MGPKVNLYLIEVGFMGLLMCHRGLRPDKHVYLFIVLTIFWFFPFSVFLALSVSAIIAWSAGQFIEKNKWVLWLGIALLVGNLWWFKYENHLNPAIPIGVSFYTLMLIAYLCEIHYKNIAPQRLPEVFIYAGYLPRLLQGPVELPGPFFTQPLLAKITVREKQRFFFRFLTGLFQKLVLANGLNNYVFQTDFAEKHYSGLAVLIYLYIYALYLYFDFSGYTNMAIALAGFTGHNLPENFNKPFTATSLTDFWRRWHMSLIAWLNAYVFQPLSYSLRTWGKAGIAIALLVTFVLSGLWHNLSLPFLCWGLLHGFFLVLEFLFTKREKSASTFWGWLYTFNLFSLLNIFFFSKTMEQAWGLLLRLADIRHFIPERASDLFAIVGGGEWEQIFNAALVLLLVILGLAYGTSLKTREKEPSIFKMVLLIFVIMIFGCFKSTGAFIYENF